MRHVFLCLALLFILTNCTEPTYETGSLPEESEMPGSFPPPPPPPTDNQSPEDLMAPEESAANEDQEMDNLLANLKSYPIAYETPHLAQQGTAFDVTLAIDGSGDDSAIEGLPGRQNITENTARLSKLVEAKLSGAAFEIQSANAATQHLLPHRETVWRWTVMPHQAGKHDLYLEIFANVDGDTAVMLESFSDVIDVEITKAENKPRFMEDARLYISVFGGLVSLLLGMIALKGHLNNRRKD